MEVFDTRGMLLAFRSIFRKDLILVRTVFIVKYNQNKSNVSVPVPVPVPGYVIRRAVRNAYKTPVQMPGDPRGRHRHVWDSNILMDHKEVWCVFVMDYTA